MWVHNYAVFSVGYWKSASVHVHCMYHVCPIYISQLTIIVSGVGGVLYYQQTCFDKTWLDTEEIPRQNYLTFSVRVVSLFAVQGSGDNVFPRVVFHAGQTNKFTKE